MMLVFHDMVSTDHKKITIIGTHTKKNKEEEVEENKLCVDCRDEYTFLESQSYNKALEWVEGLLLKRMEKLTIKE